MSKPHDIDPDFAEALAILREHFSADHAGDGHMMAAIKYGIARGRELERSLGIPMDIGAAPEDDGWVLAYMPGRSEKLPPWALATRCDGGWCDEEGYGVDPTVWVRLPDPQPAPTGWRKAEGQIRISSAWSEQIPWLTHIIEVVKPDGEADLSREPDLASSLGEARQRAAAWADKIGLPVIEADDGNVLPFKRKEPTP